MNLNIDAKGSINLLALGHYGLELWKAAKEGKELPKEDFKPLSEKKRTLLIGWDSADWNFIVPLLEQGKMPALKKMMQSGAYGNIKTLEPSLSPMLWTSIATGKYADKHGIYGFVEPKPDNSEVRPIQGSSRKCHAIWNILGSQGLKSNVIGWWPSHPAEPINGVMVSNQFHKIKHDGKGSKIWFEKNAVHPKSVFDQIKKLRIHTKDLTEAHLVPFVPDAVKVDQEKDKSLSHIGDALAQLSTVQATTTYLMQNTDWDMTAVYFNDLDIISHKFGKYTSVRPQNVPEEEFNLYTKVVEGFYRFYDMMLDRLMVLAGPNTNVILLSDHGFKLGAEKLTAIPDIAAGIALEHNDYGILCMTGPGVNQGSHLYEANLLDIAPTVLAMNGLPVGEDMDGKVLQSALLDEPKAPIASWEEQEGDFGRHDPNEQVDPIASKEALDQLIDLGYIEELDDDLEERLDATRRESQYNLSKVLSSQQRYDEALEILEQLYSEDMVDLRYNSDLINIYIIKEEFDESRRVLGNFRKFDISKLVNFDQIEGRIYLEEKNYEKAEEYLLKAYETSPGSSKLLKELGILYNRTKKYSKAEGFLKRPISRGIKHPILYHNMGIALLRQKKFEEAITFLVSTLELKPTFAAAHYHLGECLYELQDYKNAIGALENCLRFNPGINRARNLLLNIYRYYAPDAEKYESLKSVFDKTREDEVIIVTGLPRSGTSMMMQMLHEGGIDLLVDDKREADENNPKGYYELDAVKSSMKDTSWLGQAGGKAVKVVTPLIKSLNLKSRFKVIWIERKISEVIMSQEEMLKRKDPARKVTYNMNLENQFLKMNEEAEDFLAKKNNVEVLKLKHEDVLANPETAAESIFEFLGGRGDKSRMAAAVDTSLHRVKIEKEHFKI